jgi:hypothetical protein
MSKIEHLFSRVVKWETSIVSVDVAERISSWMWWGLRIHVANGDVSGSLRVVIFRSFALGL